MLNIYPETHWGVFTVEATGSSSVQRGVRLHWGNTTRPPWVSSLTQHWKAQKGGVCDYISIASQQLFVMLHPRKQDLKINSEMECETPPITIKWKQEKVTFLSTTSWNTKDGYDIISDTGASQTVQTKIWNYFLKQHCKWNILQYNI